MKINRTTQRTIEILELVASSEEELTLNEIAKKLDMPKSSAFDILETLVSCNMLYINDPKFKTYSIGVKAYVIGNTYSKTSLLLKASKPILEELARNTGKTAMVGKENNNHIIITSKADPEKRFFASHEVGDFLDIYCTAVGKAVLAFSPCRTQIIEMTPLVKKASQTITSKEDLNIELDSVVEKGYAIAIEESVDRIYSIASPIYDCNDVVSAAISIVGIYDFKEDLTEEIELIKQAANKISRSLGSNKF